MNDGLPISGGKIQDDSMDMWPSVLINIWGFRMTERKNKEQSLNTHVEDS